MAEKVDLLGIGISQITIQELLSEIERCIVQRLQFTITYVNFHSTNLTNSIQHLPDLFRTFNIVYPDGIAIKWALRSLGYLKTNNSYILRGTEIWAPYMYSRAAEQNWGIYLFGGHPGFAAKSAVNLKNFIPGIRIVGTHHGFLRSDEELHEVINEINRSGAVILLVGMSQPKQEEWIITNKNQLHATVIIAVGGYFDKVSKSAVPYPEWVNRYSLFWLSRLLKEPKRLWKRYTLGIAVFGLRVLWVKFKSLSSHTNRR